MFEVVVPFIVASPESWEMNYRSIIDAPTLRKAINWGIDVLDHDDFWVIELENDDRTLIQIYHSDGQERPVDEKEIQEVKEKLLLV